MIAVQEHTGFIKVEEYSLASWLAEVETVINQGYTFDFESNDTHPLSFGSLYTVVMVPSKGKQASKAPVAQSITIQLDTTEVRALIDEKINEVKAQNEGQQESVVPLKVDGRKKK